MKLDPCKHGKFPKWCINCNIYFWAKGWVKSSCTFNIHLQYTTWRLAFWGGEWVTSWVSDSLFWKQNEYFGISESNVEQANNWTAWRKPACNFYFIFLACLSKGRESDPRGPFKIVNSHLIVSVAVTSTRTTGLLRMSQTLSQVRQRGVNTLVIVGAAGVTCVNSGVCGAEKSLHLWPISREHFYLESSAKAHVAVSWCTVLNRLRAEKSQLRHVCKLAAEKQNVSIWVRACSPEAASQTPGSKSSTLQDLSTAPISLPNKAVCSRPRPHAAGPKADRVKGWVDLRVGETRSGEWPLDDW